MRAARWQAGSLNRAFQLWCVRSRATRPVPPIPNERIAALYGQRWDIETCFDHLKTTMGMNTLRCQTTGGGGWGDPLEREPELVALDVLEGKVQS